MIVVLSPAKSLDFEAVDESVASSTPIGIDDADYLIEELQKLSPAKVKTLLGTSDSLTRLNQDRFQDWKTQPKKQCVYSYDGPAFKSLKVPQLTAEDLDFAQSHLRILSALYGVLRPLDLIKPYRLEMGSKLVNKEGKDLYMYWKDRIRSWLERDLNAAPEDERFLVNCASQEYARAVDMKALRVPVYQITFPGPAVHAKTARGAMVRHIILNRVRKPEELKAFTGNDGEWAFQPGRSSQTEFVFLRTAHKAEGRPDGTEHKPATKRQRRA